MMNFRNWLLLTEDASRPGAKQGLYPPGYGGICLYPPPDLLNWSADAITYMPEKDKRFQIIYTKEDAKLWGVPDTPKNEIPPPYGIENCQKRKFNIKLPT